MGALVQSRPPIPFMHKRRHQVVAINQFPQWPTKLHRESTVLHPDHHPLYLDMFFEIEQRKFQGDRLASGDSPGCPDKQPSRRNVFDDVSVGAFPDGVSGNYVGCTAVLARCFRPQPTYH